MAIQVFLLSMLLANKWHEVLAFADGESGLYSNELRLHGRDMGLPGCCRVAIVLRSHPATTYPCNHILPMRRHQAMMRHRP